LILLLSFTFLLLAESNSTQELELNTLNDETIHLLAKEDRVIFKEYNQSVVFLLFFGHKCKPCLDEIPELKKLQEKAYRDLKILAIDIHGYNAKDLKAFKEEHKINYTLLTREDNRDFLTFIKAKTSWRGALPFMLAFNKKGELKLVHIGALNFKKFDAIYNAIK